MFKKVDTIKVLIIGILIIAAGHVIEFIYLQKEDKQTISSTEKFELSSYFVGLALFVLIHYLVAKVPVLRAHILIKIILAYSLVLCILKVQLFDIETQHFPYDGYLLFYFFVVAIVAHRIELVYLVIAILLIIFGFYAHDVVRFSE